MSNFSEMTLVEMWPVMEEQIKTGKTVKFTPGGNSMRPMLYSGRDSVTLVKPQGRLKKYDQLYREILHNE